MEDWVWIIGLGLVSAVAFRYGYSWWRNRKAAKLADELLANIVKGKDSFRR